MTSGGSERQSIGVPPFKVNRGTFVRTPPLDGESRDLTPIGSIEVRHLLFPGDDDGWI